MLNARTSKRAQYERKVKVHYSSRLDLVRGAYPGAPSVFRAGMSIPSSPNPRFSELSAVLRALDEALVSESDATPVAPEGPDLFSLVPRSQPTVLGLLATGLEDLGGCSTPEDEGTEVGYTVTLFVPALDLGLDVVLINGSVESFAAEPEALGIRISSL